MQELLDEMELTIIRVFGKPEHGKGKGDHLGGIVKSTLEREIAAGEY